MRTRRSRCRSWWTWTPTACRAGCTRARSTRRSSSTCTGAAGATAASRPPTGCAGGSPTAPAARCCRWATGSRPSTCTRRALEDVETVLGYVRREGAGLGVDPSRLAIGGDSAGGLLATVAARRQRDAAMPLDYQVLIYPVIDPMMASESYDEVAATGWTGSRCGWPGRRSCRTARCGTRRTSRRLPCRSGRDAAHADDHRRVRRPARRGRRLRRRADRRRSARRPHPLPGRQPRLRPQTGAVRRGPGGQPIRSRPRCAPR